MNKYMHIARSFKIAKANRGLDEFETPLDHSAYMWRLGYETARVDLRKLIAHNDFVRDDMRNMLTVSQVKEFLKPRR